MCRLVGLLLVPMLLSACVTTELTPAGENVRVTSNAEAVEGCELLGETQASDRLNTGIAQSSGEENTFRRMRNQAAAMGGNVVHLLTNDTGFYGASARGEVYRCR